MNADTKTMLTEEQMAKMIDAVGKGLPVADAVNMSPEVLESLYALAHKHYTAQNYKDAHILFEALCMYKYNDSRFWMGLAACRQALGFYKEAADTFGAAGLMTNFKNPEPLWYAANCYLKLNDKESALGVLGGMLAICDVNNASHMTYKAKGEALQEHLQSK